MALIDYISPAVLSEEGFIHKSCQSEMLGNLDPAFMAEMGWANLKPLQKREVAVSVSKAAEIMGITPPTLEGYIKMGFINKTPNGKILLLTALSFDYKAAKRKYLASKHAYNATASV